MIYELGESAWGVISAWLLFLLGAAVALRLCRTFGVPAKRSLLLYAWHAVFSVVYAVYVIKNGGDALTYYQAGVAGQVEFSLGTSAVSFITVFFASYLGLTFLGACLGFHLFGFVGLLALDGALRTAVVGKPAMVRRAASALIFLPSISFWSAAVGKDALAFMAAGLALWSALDMQRRNKSLVFAIACMLIVRPHIAVLMVVALAGSLLFKTGLSLKRRAMLGVAASIVAAILVPFALNYAGLEDSSASGFSAYVEQRQQYNQEGGGGIDISSMSLPMKLFTYLFRPLPLEANSITALAASLDNVVLLILVSAWLFARIRRRPVVAKDNRPFMWFYVVMAWLILALTTANLGISVRQKWMFVPMLMYLCLSAIARRRPPPGRPSIASTASP